MDTIPNSGFLNHACNINANETNLAKYWDQVQSNEARVPKNFNISP